MRKLYPLLTVLGIVALACGTSTNLTPTMDVNNIVAQTIAAYTVEAALTQSASPTQTPTLQPPPLATATPQEVAPNPLPVSNTGIILNIGECFNFDSGQVIAAPDAQCEVWLNTGNMVFQQMNGSQLSGYVTMDPPTRSHCVAGRYEPGDLAVQTDLFMCFITNETQVGFIVVREYRGSAPFTGIVFDYWVFR